MQAHVLKKKFKTVFLTKNRLSLLAEEIPGHIHLYSSTHFFPKRFLVLRAVGLIYPLKLCLSSAAQDLDEPLVVGAQATASFLHDACVVMEFWAISQAV